MDNTLANALERTLGIQRPQSPEHACQLLEAFRPKLVRLRRIADAVESTLGVPAIDAQRAENALARLKADSDAQQPS